MSKGADIHPPLRSYIFNTQILSTSLFFKQFLHSNDFEFGLVHIQWKYSNQFILIQDVLGNGRSILDG